MNTAQAVATALVEIGAIGFSLEKPITFKSGIVSPIYIDNRIFPAHPTQWQTVITGFSEIIQEQELAFDYIAGIETAGIPHSAALGFSLQKPSVFVRKAAKDHGTKKMVEGGVVTGKKVLLIEDHVSTGLSSLTGVTSLRDSGATVTDCLTITSYEMPKAIEQFAAADVRLHTLTTFTDILSVATDTGVITQTDAAVVRDWLQDPHGWFSRQSN